MVCKSVTPRNEAGVHLMRHTFLLIGTLSAFCFGCSSGPYVRSSPPPTPVVVAAGSAAAVSFGAEHAALIRAYYAEESSGSGSGRGRGRGRSGGLPPGIAKNLQRGKPLPPGIAKQYLPPDLLVRLPPLSAGLEYVVIAGKLLLVEIATQVVRDVLIDALFD